MEKKSIPTWTRSEGPIELQLMQFYELSRQERKTHIDALKQLKFTQLSERDKGIVYFWFQNWSLTDWPSENKNFISLND